MALFKPKSPVEKLESELSALRGRAETLGNRHAAAEKAFAHAKDALQRYLLEADLDGDEKTRTKLEASLASCALTRDNYADALAKARHLISDLETRLADENTAVQRKAAAAKLAADIASVETALPPLLEHGRRLTDALEALHFHYESAQMRAFLVSALQQVEIASGFTLTELRGNVRGIESGAMPIPAAKPQPAKPVAKEPAPKTYHLFAMRPITWKDSVGRRQYGQQFEDHDVTPAAATRGLSCGALVQLHDPRRKDLRGSRGGQHVNKSAVDLLDLDDEEACRPSHVQPVMRSDPLATANIVEIDRGPERKIAFPVSRI